MQNLIRRLEKRGWSRKEISKAVGIIKNAKKDKTKQAKFRNELIYGVLLALIITANFAISIALIPYLIVLRGFLLYFVIALLGACFGFLFETAIRSIEHLEREHHLLLTIMLPLVALANLLIISRMANGVIMSLNLKNVHDPFAVSFVYALSFVLPYFIYRFVMKRGYYGG